MANAKYKYHVTASESCKKLITVDKKEELLTKALEECGLNDTKGSYSLQLWDADFEDWLDINIDDLPDKGKVKLVNSAAESHEATCEGADAATTGSSSLQISNDASPSDSVKGPNSASETTKGMKGPAGISTSSPINLSSSANIMLKEKIKKHSNLTTSVKGMPQYQVQFENCKKYAEVNAERCDFGTPKSGTIQTEKVILAVGATGAGKSTFINGVLNALLGVDWDDEFRFRLVDENIAPANQHLSQTQKIMIYTLHHQDGFQCPYTLTIIDTPGYGDTTGIKRDKQITKLITDLFTSSEYGIDHIDAVGFVTPSALARLTPTQKYIWDSILALFGEDIASNILLLVTFSDDEEAPVLNCIQEANVPFHASFEFNNCAIYASNTSKSQISHMFWDKGSSSYQDFLDTLGRMKPASLTLTEEVLRQREKLEVIVNGIQGNIKLGLTKLEQFTKELNVVKQIEADLEINKNYEYEVEEDTMVHVPLDPGKYVTNCVVCNYTCHYPCAIPNDDGKAGCAAMNRDGYCNVCTGKCYWNKHHNVPYRIDQVKKKNRKTAEDMLQRYKQAESEKITAKQLTQNILDEFENLQMDIVFKADEIRKAIERLKEISLRPSPLTVVEYIELLIEVEQQEAKPGWQSRVEQLTKEKEQAEALCNLAKDKGYDPFKQYRDILEQSKCSGIDVPSFRGFTADLQKK